MRKTFFIAKILCICTISLLGMNACVDDAYDVSKDIDMNVTVGGDLTLSGNSTEEITLEKIFEIDENCIVQADPVTGDYVLVKDAANSSSQFHVERVDLQGDEIDIEKADVNIVFNQNPTDINISDIDIPFAKAITFKLLKENVTEELLALNWAKLNTISSLDLNFSGSQNIGSLGIRKGMRMVLPEFVTLESNDSRCRIIDGHILEMTQDIKLEKYVRTSFDVSIVKMDFTETPDQGLVERGKLSIEDEVQFEGNAFIVNGYVDENGAEVNLEAELDIAYIDMKEVNAQVDPNIEIDITNIQIDNLPDFLQDEEVKICLTDPRMFLTVTNESPVSVNLQTELIPVKGGQQNLDKKVVVGHATDKEHQIIIPGNVKDYVICIHQIDDNEGIEADAFAVVPNLNSLVERIPDEIMITNTQAKALPEDVTITMGTTYTVNTLAEVNAPLQFNEGTKIIYTDVLGDWAEDIKDIDVKKAFVTLDATNTVPMNMTITADAINKNGEIMNNVEAVVTGNVTAGSKENPSLSKLEIELTAGEGSFRELDGIRYRVDAMSAKEFNGVNLNANQLLKLDNITVKVVGGVHVDLN